MITTHHGHVLHRPISEFRVSRATMCYFTRINKGKEKKELRGLKELDALPDEVPFGPMYGPIIDVSLISCNFTVVPTMEPFKERTLSGPRYGFEDVLVT